MGYTGIIIGMAILLGWIISEVFKSFNNDDGLGYKIIGIAMIILTISLICGFTIGLREEIRYDALEQYFDGNIEITENVDTVRTYKFN